MTSIDAFLFSPMEIAPGTQPRSQGRWCFSMALYGQALTHLPHMIHLLWSMVALWLIMEMASLGQVWTHRVAMHPRQAGPTSIWVTGHSSQATFMTSTMAGYALSPPIAILTRSLMTARSL